MIRGLKLVCLIMTLSLFYNNCSKVSVDNIEQSSQAVAQDIAPGTVFEECDLAKQTGKLTVAKLEVKFDNQNKTCAWGKNGNINKIEGIVTARTENIQQVQIPADAKVCQVKMIHKETSNFVYDDNIILTLNNAILASTTDFSKHFPANSNGVRMYNWESLINKPGQVMASDSMPENQYCFGRDKNLSTCVFPKTETVGNMQLNFSERAIQTVLAATTQTSVKIGMITTGDNNDSDCLHTPISILVDVEYYR